MNKPMSMSVKEYLIRTLAVKMAVNEKMIEAVVNHQYQSANEAMDINQSVEISGFGKFMFNKKKALKKMDKLCMKRDYCVNVLANPDASEAATRKAETMLESVSRQIKMLKPTIDNELQTDL